MAAGRLGTLWVAASMMAALSGVAPTAGEAARPPCLDVRDDMGFRVWTSEASPASQSVADRLQVIAEKYPDQIAGVAFCSDQRAIEVYFASPTSSVEDEITAVATSTSVPVFARPLGVSRWSATKLVTQMLEAAGPDLVLVGPDPINGGVLISGIKTATDASRSALPAEVSVHEMPGSSAFTAAGGRRSDIAPWNMGVELWREKGAGLLEECTAGVRVMYQGVTKSLTAGHCGAGDWKTRGVTTFFGRTQTTTWASTPGTSTTSSYGDWQLLKDSTYSTWLLTEPDPSNNGFTMSTADFCQRPVGQSLCISGAETKSQVCRLFVISSGASISLKDRDTGYFYTIAHATIARYDPNLTGSYACGAMKRGDCGGPVYYSNGSGQVVGYGLVTAYRDDAGEPCIYVFTQLSGVRAWNPGVSY